MDTELSHIRNALVLTCLCHPAQGSVAHTLLGLKYLKHSVLCNWGGSEMGTDLYHRGAKKVELRNNAFMMRSVKLSLMLPQCKSNGYSDT